MENIIDRYIKFIEKIVKDDRKSRESKKKVKTKMIYGMEVVIS